MRPYLMETRQHALENIRVTIEFRFFKECKLVVILKHGTNEAISL